jgi:PIN like domain
LTRVYFTDRDLGKRFPEILREGGLAVERHADHFDDKTPDEDWLEEIADRWWIPRSRQLFFELRGHRYKAKYNHTLGKRGGIEIVEIGEGRGSPEIASVGAITSLDEAAQFYANPRLSNAA